MQGLPYLSLVAVYSFYVHAFIGLDSDDLGCFVFWGLIRSVYTLSDLR